MSDRKSLPIDGYLLLLGIDWLQHASVHHDAEGCHRRHGPNRWNFVVGDRLKLVLDRYALGPAFTRWTGWRSLDIILRDNPQWLSSRLDLAPLLDQEPDEVRNAFRPFFAALACGELDDTHLMNVATSAAA